jgi:hypothetical protein
MITEFYKMQSSSVAGNLTTAFLNDTTSPLIVNYGEAILTTANSSAFQRRVIAAVKDESDNNFVDIHAGVTQASNRGPYHHSFHQGVYRETAVVGSSIQVAMPQQFLVPQGWSFEVRIENGIASDSYDTSFILSKYK